MGRLYEFFDAHRDNVEEAVSEVLKKADSTIESLDRKVKELERRLRDVAGEEPVTNREEQEEGIVTSDQTEQQQTEEARKTAKSTRSRR